MLETRILEKSLKDIEIKLMLCKTHFEWELLAKKYQEAVNKIEQVHEETEIPETLQKVIDTIREALVEKKGKLPPQDLSDFFK
jgi:23S rRNA A2030 N6-methylase RlmJ